MESLILRATGRAMLPRRGVVSVGHLSINGRRAMGVGRRTVEQTRVIEIGTLRRAGYVGQPARNWWKWRDMTSFEGGRSGALVGLDMPGWGSLICRQPTSALRDYAARPSPDWALFPPSTTIRSTTPFSRTAVRSGAYMRTSTRRRSCAGSGRSLSLWAAGAVL
jgi:hypothetical protein